ncbi:hypothetical protein [Desulfotomaculum copahuensis]|uniref:Uncharacterized protein n=1 Tax=Desulfotomaculum copahuensis TaxID=1838280 RepID=A0A1B7LH63_9FIRM|nr:hypothetical protein [Desulfotomaculum copahuensis]OAT85529.1 hypothetical protein A6M21_06365 [Desulfotomaculum copahuensis]
MRIEILTRQMEKKAALLTLWAAEPSFYAAGDKITLPGMEVDAGPDYLLLTTDRWEMAEQAVPLLFSIAPAAYAPALSELSTDLKILVTAAARPLPEIIQCLDVLEHLDVERGELAGHYRRQWHSRDVSVTAPVSLMVQGGVAVAKIKFSTHFRDSEHHCRQLLEQVSLRRLLTVFTTETSRRQPPRTAPPAITNRVPVTPENCSRFLNCCPGTVRYLAEPEAYRVQFDGQNHLTFQSGRDKEILLDIYLEDPDCLTVKLVEQLKSILQVKELTLQCVVSGLTLEPQQLLGKLKFQKEPEYYLFSRRDDFLARYDIKKREMTLTAVVALSPENVTGRLKQLYRAMEQLTGEVLACGA